MADHCAWCGGTDLQAQLADRQCLSCGKHTDSFGKKVTHPHHAPASPRPARDPRPADAPEQIRAGVYSEEPTYRDPAHVPSE